MSYVIFILQISGILKGREKSGVHLLPPPVPFGPLPRPSSSMPSYRGCKPTNREPNLTKMNRVNFCVLVCKFTFYGGKTLDNDKWKLQNVILLL